MHTLVFAKLKYYFILGTSSCQCCSICQCKPSQMNNLENISNGKFDPKKGSLDYGIVITHAWIRVFEFVINISIKLPFKVWQARGDQLKASVKERENIIKKRMFKTFGLKINQPRSGGAGSSNTGNTSRKAFSEPELFAAVLELDKTFIVNLRTILICLSCQLPIDPVKFQFLCHQTAELYVENYDWYYMPATVHTILIHATQIMMNLSLPVGIFGEEGLESCNKVHKANRLHHARKDSRLNTMFDIFHRAMDASDPLISSISISKLKKNKNALPPEVNEMIMLPEKDLTDDADEIGNKEIEDFYLLLDDTELDFDDEN